MSQIFRHEGALYTPAEEHPPPQPSTAATATSTPRWSRERPRSISNSISKKKRSNLEVVKARIYKLQRYAQRQFRKMKWWQKILASLFLVVSAVGAILVTVYHTEILQLMLPVAKTLSGWPAGWLPIWGLCYIAAFPPMIGYSTSVSLAGFIYGFPNGWFIVASGTILGSTSAFLACRYYFREFAQRMVATDKRFAALALTLKHDGMKLLCMIRLCPLPYSISNGAISTFPTVKPWQFMLATALSTPKLMIHIFIGTRLRMLAEEGRKMDGKTKAINYGSLIGGIILGVGTGLIIYRRTVARTKQLEHEERQRLRASRGSLSSGRQSIDRSSITPGFTDFDEEVQGEPQERDPLAAQAVSLISELLEGDEEDETYSDEEVERYIPYHDADHNDLESALVNLDDRRSVGEPANVRTDSVALNGSRDVSHS